MSMTASLSLAYENIGIGTTHYLIYKVFKKTFEIV